MSPWRRDPVVAFVPARSGVAPSRLHAGLAQRQPLTSNDSCTRLYRLHCRVVLRGRRPLRGRASSSTTTTRSGPWWRLATERPCCRTRPARRRPTRAPRCRRCGRAQAPAGHRAPQPRGRARHAACAGRAVALAPGLNPWPRHRHAPRALTMPALHIVEPCHVLKMLWFQPSHTVVSSCGPRPPRIRPRHLVRAAAVAARRGGAGAGHGQPLPSNT